MSEKEFSEIEQKIKSELQPFIDGIITKKADFELYKQAFTDFKERFIHATKIAELLAKQTVASLEKYPKGTIFEPFVYLGLVEGLGNSIVDIIVMLLIANGRDFHIECLHDTPRTKHATSIKDLEKERVSLTTRLNFLEANGVQTLAKHIDSELRNRIAHLDIDIVEDEIYIKGKPAGELVRSSSDKLVHAVVITLNLLEELARAKGLK